MASSIHKVFRFVLEFWDHPETRFKKKSAYTGSMWTISQNHAKHAFTHKSVSRWMASASPSTLKHFADQLSTVFTAIFNTSLETCHVPACFRVSTIIPVPIPKKPVTTGLQTSRPDLCGHEVFWKPCALPCQILNLKLGNMSLNPRPSAPDPPKAAFFLPVHQQLHQFVKLLNFTDDSMLIGPISGGNESAYRWEIDHPVTWCN